MKIQSFILAAVFMLGLSNAFAQEFKLIRVEDTDMRKIERVNPELAGAIRDLKGSARLTRQEIDLMSNEHPPAAARTLLNDLLTATDDEMVKAAHVKFQAELARPADVNTGNVNRPNPLAAAARARHAVVPVDGAQSTAAQTHQGKICPECEAARRAQAKTANRPEDLARDVQLAAGKVGGDQNTAVAAPQDQLPFEVKTPDKDPHYVEHYNPKAGGFLGLFGQMGHYQERIDLIMHDAKSTDPHDRDVLVGMAEEVERENPTECKVTGSAACQAVVKAALDDVDKEVKSGKCKAD